MNCNNKAYYWNASRKYCLFPRWKILLVPVWKTPCYAKCKNKNADTNISSISIIRGWFLILIPLIWFVTSRRKGLKQIERNNILESKSIEIKCLALPELEATLLRGFYERWNWFRPSAIGPVCCRCYSGWCCFMPASIKNIWLFVSGWLGVIIVLKGNTIIYFLIYDEHYPFILLVSIR